MINKKGLWFLTLFSLILVLGVYYVTMPSDILKENTSEVEKEEDTTEVIEKNDSNYITALKMELDEEREKLTKEYEETINSKDATSEDKNTAYEAIKAITSTKSLEEELEDKINKKYKLNSFVKLDNTNCQVVIDSTTHDIASANNIMRLVQEEFNYAMNISVKYS